MTATQPTAALTAPVNLRDLGGLATADGRRTRSGVLYRGDVPLPGDVAPAHVAPWPPRVVVDLRSRFEAEGRTHPLAGPDTVVHHVPLLDQPAQPQPEQPAPPSLRDLYLGLLERSGTDLARAFRLVVAGVADGAPGPVLVHCAAGKDRTGVVVALLLYAAGVRRDAIVADYVRTDRNMPLVLRRLSGEPATLPPGVDEDAVRQLVSAPAEAIEVVLTRLDEHPGGVHGWLCEHGVTRAELTAWATRFLE